MPIASMLSILFKLRRLVDPIISCIIGSVVECVIAIHATRVRFSDNARFYLSGLSAFVRCIQIIFHWLFACTDLLLTHTTTAICCETRGTSSGGGRGSSVIWSTPSLPKLFILRRLKALSTKCIIGSVVECVIAIHATRVRFSDNARFYLSGVRSLHT